MAQTKYLEVKGENEAEVLKKLAALVKIQELDGNSLTRLATLSESEKARTFLKTELAFAGLKVFLKKA